MKKGMSDGIKKIGICYLVVIFNVSFTQHYAYAKRVKVDKSNAVKIDENVSVTVNDGNNNINKEITRDDLIGKDKKEEVPEIKIMSSMSMFSSSISRDAIPSSLPENLIKNLHFDASSGSASIAIPLFAPKGRGGVQVSLGLTYSPRRGNGVLGFGWGIDFGSIERSMKNGIPNYDNSDTFMASIGGSVFELVGIGEGNYQSKVEGAFMKFYFDGNTWEVKDKSGNTYYFGLDSILEDNSRESEGSKVFRWYLSEIKDVLGNYVFIRHFEDGNFEVRYTGEPGTDRNALNSGTHEFQYKIISELELSNREDVMLSYKSGFHIENNKRIKSISVFSGDGADLMRKYEVDYAYSQKTGRTLLTSLTEYGADGVTSLPLISFSYSDDSPGSYTLSSILSDPLIGDNLWNARFMALWEGHDCLGPLPPYVIDGYSPGTWSGAYTQNNGSYGGSAWSISAKGNLQYTGVRDLGHYFYTYVYVTEDITIPISTSHNDDDEAYYVNSVYGNNSSEWGANNQRTGWRLKAGYNLVEHTNYHQHQEFWHNLNKEVADNVALMSSMQVILPQLSSDFNGDGLADVATYYASNGDVKVALSNGNAFLPKEKWINDIGVNKRVVLGDFNSDGKADICSVDVISGQWNVALSNGSGFDDTVNWISNFGANGQVSAADFNGDGYTDLVSFVKDSGYYKAKIALNEKGSFVEYKSKMPIVGKDAGIPFLADFNGDGLPDFGLFNKSSGSWEIRLNVGDLNSEYLLDEEVTNFGANMNMVVSDFNFDGKADIGFYDYFRGKIIYRKSKSTIFGEIEEVAIDFALRDSLVQIQSSDFNGDGITDFIAYNELGNVELAMSDGEFVDLLKVYNNGIGGVSTIKYDSSSEFQNTQMPFSIPVVKKVTVSNSRGDEYSTRYSYSNGLWDPNEREFMGFGLVRITDALNNYAETKYLQDDVYLKGRVDSAASYDSSGLMFNKIENKWETEIIDDTVEPNIKYVKLMRSDSFIYNGDNSGKRTAVINYYDERPQIGNLTKSVQLGEVDFVTGDNIGLDSRSVETEYHNNRSGENWLIGLPKHIVSKDSDGRKIGESWFYYDESEALDELPQVGLLTKNEQWASDAESTLNPAVRYVYDGYGNITSTIDPKGNTSKVIYDNKFHMFALSVENALGHLVSSEYYGVNDVLLDSGDGYKGLFGQLRSTTDPNNQEGKQSYDVFGRVFASVSPVDTISYPTAINNIENFGDHSKVTTQIRLVRGYAETVKTVSFYDGLGRLIQTKTPTEEEGKFLVSGQKQYELRGLVDKEYLMAFSEASQDVIDSIDINQPYSSVVYDALGRPIENINPDGTYSSVSFSDWTVVSIDANGHKTETDTDAYGRLIERREYLGADGRCSLYPYLDFTQCAVTKYSYDARDNLVKTEDAHNNITSIGYDNLGRKIYMDDPDMGYWEYVYDLNGNLIEQTDAKGQSISFAYDELNRLLSKTDGGDISVAYTYDDLANGFAKGKLTRVDYQGGSAEFEYDELGREIQSTKSIGGKDYVVERQYDDLNNLKEIIYPDGSKVFYKYNNIGQIESVSNEEKSFDQHTRLINETQNERKNVWEQIVHFYTDWFEPNVLGIREAQAMEILFAPAAPTIESAEARNKEVELTWRCSRVNFNVSYTIKYGTIRGYYDTVVKINDIGKRSYIVDGLTNGVKYYFVMTAINPAGESRNSNRVTAIPQFPQNQAPNVDAGLDIEITLPDNVNLYGVVSDDELPEPPAKTNVQWSHVSGAGVVTFADRAISNTTATFSEAGTYVLRLTANDGELNSSDELTIIVNSELQKNQVPILNAIGDKIVNENEMLSFAIIANDLDGDVVTYKAMNLPAGAIFDTSTQEIDWMPTFDQSGEYAGVLFEVTDGKDIAFEEIVITVENVNRAPEKLTAKAISTSRIDLTWELSIDVPVVAAYRVYRDGVIVAETNELNYSDIGLRVETQYVYNITAIDAAQNESLLSGDVIVLTLGTPEIDDTLIVVDVDYNVMGQAVKIMYGSGTVENYEYDDLSFRLIRKYTDSSAGEILQDLNYKYDAVGNIVSIIDNVNTATQSFKYDEINRLIEARGESYESKDFVYDEIGNIIEKDGKSYYYGEGGAGPHAVTLLSDGATFTYDENGNMQSRQLGAGGDLTIYSYDSENRLIEVEKNSSLLASYAYDGDGGRTRQATDNGQKTIVYVGSLYEKNGNENYGTNTVFLGSQRVAAVTNGLTYYYHADHLGGTNILTDSAGEKKEKIEYLPFGEINEYAYEKFGSDEEVAKLYFTGKRKDDETGLYYYGARYYDPEWGRFITADSLVQDPVNPITLNRYSYCGNNPIVRVDPTGHFWMELLGFLVMGSQVYNDYQFASGQISAGQWGANLGVSVMTAGTLSVPAGPVSSVGYGWRLMQASGVMSIGSQIAGQTGLSDLQSGLAAGAKYAGMAYTGLNVLKGMKDWAVGKLDVRDMAINPSTIQSGDNAFVNGIDTDLNGAFNKALLLNKNKSLAINKVVHNATSGFIADMTEVALQKLTFTSSVDRQLANMLKVLNNVTLIGHSQGSVIVGNTLLNLGFRDARNAVVDAKFLSTPLSQPRASISAAIGGTRGVFEYFNEYGDPINIIGPNINPAKFVSGFTFQFNKH